MRKSDASANSWLVCRGPKPADILLNGRSQKGAAVFFADAEKGVIERYVKDKGGEYKVDKWRKRVITEVVRGDVEIVWEGRE